jgi:DNA polymerase-3 subunit delta
VQLTVDRLHERLRAQPLAPIYFFYGDEPLQLLECADAIRRRAHDDGVSERMVFDAEVGIDWSLVSAEANAMSLFASRRLFEIRLGEKKPDKGGVEVLERLVRRDGSEDVVLVTAAKLDGQTRKSRWVKLLEDHAVTVATRDLRGPALAAAVAQAMQGGR